MQEVESLIARYAGDDAAAFFVMTFADGGGLRWPPADSRLAALRYAVSQLRISYVNDQHLHIYSFPEGESPLGWGMAELTGSARGAAAILEDFYDNGGFSRVMMVRPRMDGHLMWLRGEYRVLREGDRIVGHYGVELDVTDRLVRPPDPTTFH